MAHTHLWWNGTDRHPYCRGCGEPQPPELVTVTLPREDVEFIRGFHPERDRTASRADMVRVIEHLQAALRGEQP